MGLIKKTKEAFKNAKVEKSDFGSPEPKEPLSKGLLDWLNNSSDEKRKLIYGIALVVFVAFIIFLLGWSINRVYFQPDTYQTNQSKTEENSKVKSTENYLPYFDNIKSWSFCLSNVSEYASNIYKELLDKGMEKGTTIYCYSDVTESGDYYVTYIKESRDSRYFQIKTKKSLEFEIKEVSEKDIPNYKEQEQLNKDAEERATRKAETEKSDTSSSSDTVTSTVDTLDISHSVQLTDSNALREYLSDDCVDVIADSLIEGMKNSYGFNAIPSSSYVMTNTIKKDGDNATFYVQFTDKDKNRLVVEVTWNASDGMFSGKKVVNG